MSDHTTPNPDRLHELLADQALRTLSEEETMELARLLDGSRDESYELAAASLELALHEHDDAPRDVMARVESAVLSRVTQERSPRPDTMGEPDASVDVVYRFNAIPWLATAAAVLFAVMAWLPGAQQSPIDQRGALMASGVSYTQWNWGAIHADDSTLSGYVEGDVVWSDEAQEGYMRFVGLAMNDPSVEQYQLWIFDSSRSAERPVDGGVFDVTESGEVIVPIDAKLSIDEATMFAITVERPGGVVVSDRSRLPLLASAPPS
ncbi:MAG: anti-sigma factor [Phycisphaerales bacterium JB043]